MFSNDNLIRKICSIKKKYLKKDIFFIHFVIIWAFLNQSIDLRTFLGQSINDNSVMTFLSQTIEKGHFFYFT